MKIDVSRVEAAITVDVLSLVLNDPDWQEMASATDQEWSALRDLQAKMLGALR